MTVASIDTIAIVGASGQMGTLFAEDFSHQGCSVARLSRPYSAETIRDAVAQADMVMLCIPVTVMDTVLDLVVPHMAPDAILCDVGSVKTAPVKAMLAKYDGPVVGTHPLFGPVIPDGFTPKVAVMPGRERDVEAARKVSALMEACGYPCFDSTPEEHDKAIAFIQGLNFTSTVAFLAAARDVDGIENFVTPSFNRRLDAARKMITADTELFEIISESNPFLQETNRKFMTYLSLAAGGDLELLAQRAQWWWRNETY